MPHRGEPSSVDKLIQELERGERATYTWAASEPSEWTDLSAELRTRGFSMLDLDEIEPVSSEETLLNAFSASGVMPSYFSRTLTSLKECLAVLPKGSERGWVVLFRRPKKLEENEPETWKALGEIASLIHDRFREEDRGGFRLVFGI